MAWPSALCRMTMCIRRGCLERHKAPVAGVSRSGLIGNGCECNVAGAILPGAAGLWAE